MDYMDDTLFRPEPPVLADKEGVLVIKGEPFDDLTDVVRRERDCRMADLARQIESDWAVLTQLIEDCTVETGIPDFAHQHDHYLYGKAKILSRTTHHGTRS